MTHALIGSVDWFGLAAGVGFVALLALGGNALAALIYGSGEDDDE